MLRARTLDHVPQAYSLGFEGLIRPVNIAVLNRCPAECAAAAFDLNGRCIGIVKHFGYSAARGALQELHPVNLGARFLLSKASTPIVS